MDKLILIKFVGVPGSGKTCFAKQLADRKTWVWLNSDAMRLSIWGSLEDIQNTHATPETRAQNNRMTFGAMNYATRQALMAGKSVVFDSNANARAERKSTSQIEAETGAMQVVIRLRTPIDLAVQRGQDRPASDHSRQLTEDKMREVIERHSSQIEEPDAGEYVIEIDGTLSFEAQYIQFLRGLEEILNESASVA